MASEESKTKDDKSETSSNLRQYFGDGGLTEIVLPVLIVALAIYLAIGANDRLSLQGIVLTFVGVSALGVFLVRLASSPKWAAWLRLPDRRPWKWCRQVKGLRSGSLPSIILGSTLFLFLAAVFLLTFPYSSFLQAVGIAPGLAFVAIFAFLARGLRRRESTVSSLGAISLLCLVVWLWGEAGREGFVVLPMDVPAGAETAPRTATTSADKNPGGAANPGKMNSLEFTAEGLANALETEIGELGVGGRDNYAQSEAAQILAADTVHRLFPGNPWYKSSGDQPSKLAGLETSHFLANTQIHELPLGGIYHVLRHIRGKPIIEGQVLVGVDNLTIALRRSNYDFSCMSEHLSGQVADKIEQAYRGSKDVQVRDILDVVRSDYKFAHPNVPGCNPGFIRRTFSNLGLIPITPLGAEERIANVTVSNARGDYQLTEALHFAAIEAMGKLSTERLANYYDKKERYESALTYYKLALPGLFMEYDQASPNDRESARRRLVEVLIRIGDLDSEQALFKELPKLDFSKGAYALARNIARVDEREDIRVAGRIGYHYLVLAELCSIRAQNPRGQQCKIKEATYPTAESQYLSYAEVKFHMSPSQGGSYGLLSKRIGAYYARDTWAWIYANHAYVHSKIGRDATDELRCALFYGNPTAKKDCDSVVRTTTDDKLFEGNKDLRVAAASAYICRDGKRNKELCDAGQTKLKEQIKSLIEAKEPYTLNNNILIEDQLRQFYSTDLTVTIKQCPQEVPPDWLLHTNWLYLLIALKEYRAAQFSESLGDIDLAEKSLGKGGCKLKRFLQLADAFVASTYEEEPRTRVEDAEQIKYRVGRAKKYLNDIVATGNNDKSKRDELFWRASSLNAVRQAMCLDDPLVTTCQLSKGQPEKLVNAARNASDAMPENAYLRANVGIVLLRSAPKPDGREKRSEAVRQFEEAVEINPGDPWLRCLLSYAYLSEGEIEKAQAQEQFGRLLDPEAWTSYDRTAHRVWPSLTSH